VVAKNSAGSASGAVWSFTTKSQPTYTVSGYVKDSSGNGISGVTISFSGGYSSVTTASNGYWSKSGLTGSVSVTPSKSGWMFNPENATVKDASNNVNFMGTQVQTISPYNLHAISKTAFSVSLGWDMGSDIDVEYFEVQRLNHSKDYVQSSATTTEKVFYDGNLYQGTTYKYRVRAYSQYGYSNWSDPVTVTTLEANPPGYGAYLIDYILYSLPTSLPGPWISIPGGHMVRITDLTDWDGAAYNGMAFQLDYNVDDTKFLDSGKTFYTNDGEVMMIWGDVSSGGWPQTVAFKAGSKSAAGNSKITPNPLNLMEGIPGRIQISLDKQITRNPSQMVWYKTEGSQIKDSAKEWFASENHTLATSTIYATVTVPHHGNYGYFVLTGHYREEYGLFGNLNVCKPATPSAPINLMVMSTDSIGVSLGWANTSPYVESIEVYRSSNGIDYQLLKKLSSNEISYKDTNIVMGSTYHYKVRAVNKYGFSTWSNTVEQKVEQNISLVWQKNIGGSGSEFLWNIQKTLDGGYVAIGGTNSNDNGIINKGQDDVFVVRLDSGGNVTWKKSYGGNGEDAGYKILETDDGGYIFTGLTNSNTGDVSGNHGSADVWVVKLNSSGNIQWSRCYGGSGYDYASDIFETVDGNYLIAGTTDSSDGDVKINYGGFDAFVICINSNGNLLWKKVFGTNQNDSARRVIEKIDGIYKIILVSGTTGERSWITFLNASTEQQQLTVFPDSVNVFTSLTETNDGSFLIGGYSNSTWTFTGNHGGYDALVLKLNHSGQILWQKYYGGSSDDYLSEVEKTDDGGYIFTGYTYSNDGDVSGNHGNSDVWIVKIDSTGNLQWQKCLGGSGKDIGYSIKQLSQGFIISGLTNSTDGDVTVNNGLDDAWVLNIK